MKKPLFYIFLFISLSQTAHADDYKWNLIDAIMKNDLDTIDNIIKTNVSSMSITDKNLVMNFAMNYSSGENTLIVCQFSGNTNTGSGNGEIWIKIGN